MYFFQSEQFIFDFRSCAGPVSFQNHMHDVYEMIFINSGEGEYTVEGKSYAMQKHSLILTRPMKLHTISSRSSASYDRINILFDARSLSSDICEKIPSEMDVMDFRGNPIVTELFRKMVLYCEQFSGAQLQAVLLLLIEEVLFNVFLHAGQLAKHEAASTNIIVKAATEYVEAHLSEPLSVDTVCEVLHVSQSYLLQLFEKHLKITPKQYILSKKLAMAQMLLRTEMKSTEVYVQCGFQDYSAFYRAYRKYFGYAPSAESHRTPTRAIRS